MPLEPAYCPPDTSTSLSSILSTLPYPLCSVSSQSSRIFCVEVHPYTQSQALISCLLVACVPHAIQPIITQSVRSKKMSNLGRWWPWWIRQTVAGSTFYLRCKPLISSSSAPNSPTGSCYSGMSRYLESFMDDGRFGDRAARHQVGIRWETRWLLLVRTWVCFWFFVGPVRWFYMHPALSWYFCEFSFYYERKGIFLQTLYTIIQVHSV